ncbi:MAG: ATP-dependent zinc metalloprotease FtsH, partial [Agathobacter sp.]|uniref:ATP-dependent zinc metalloprotease FtsH n=1 Tax=Agathobacter sp. TaxID=2021311 RepID=UPI0027D9A383
MDNQGPNNYNYNNGPGNNGSGGNGNNGGNRPGGNGGRNNRGGQGIMAFILLTLVALFVYALISNSISHASTQEKSYSDFIKQLDKGNVKSVEFDSYEIDYKLVDDGHKDYDITYYTGRVADDELVPTLKKAKTSDGKSIEIKAAIPDNTSTWIFNILSFIVPLILLWVLLAFVSKKMGGSMGMGVGKSTAKVYVEKSTGVNFKDVAGQDEAKESLQEVVDFLHNPKRYTDIGAKLPKGALLVGPPGTGKTLLAKAVAGEAGVPFFSLAGSDFVEMFVGVGASRVRDLFKEAQKMAPCIIFIDEIDAIGKSRDSRYGGGNDEREQTLNQLLAEMDGFDTSKGLLILAATNRPEVLDKALLRPGRFDRRIIVDKPDLKGRLETLKVHSKDVKMDESVDLDALALATAGLVGSDLANMINEAAINAVKNGRQLVNQSDLFEAFELVAVGGKEKKDRVMSDKERKIVSYHEVGHALVSALQKNTEPVQKITIVPRTMGALGYTLQTPEEEKYLETKDELLAKITTYMAGRAAEVLVFNSVTSGAANDIENATKIARAMVTMYGMSDKFGMMCLATVQNQYLEGGAGLICGENTASQIDDEVLSIINSSYAEAMKLLDENREILDSISDYLYEKETITGKEFMKMFRDMKGL